MISFCVLPHLFHIWIPVSCVRVCLCLCPSPPRTEMYKSLPPFTKYFYCCFGYIFFSFPFPFIELFFCFSFLFFCFSFFPTHSKFLPFCCLDFFLCFSLRGSDLLLAGLNDTNRKSTVRLLTLCPHRKQGASQSPLFPPRPVLLHASVRRCPRRAGRAAGQKGSGSRWEPVFKRF